MLTGVYAILNDDMVSLCPDGEDKLTQVIPDGTWSYTFFGQSGSVLFNEDGTYEDLSNMLLEVGGTTETKTWEIDSSTETLVASITTDTGNSGSLTLASLSISCERIVFDGQGFGDIVFTR